MGKISDIWVRLGLKKDGFDKGMDDAAKKAEGFGSSLSKIKAGAVAVWAAIGASVVAFGKKMIETTNAVGDKWASFTAQAKAGWDTFVQSLSAMNWDNFIGRFREAIGAAKELQSALDAEFEISNSIKLQKAAMADELAELEVLARDATKSYEERASAAQKYLDKVKPLYEQELALAKKLENAQLGKWIAGSGLKDSEQLRKDLRQFLIDYGKDETLAGALGRMLELREQYNMALSVQASKFREGDARWTSPVIEEYRALRDIVKNYGKNAGYGTDIYKLAEVYEKMRGDADTAPLVDAMIAAGNAAAAFDRETKRMQSALNTSLAQMGASTGAAVGSVAEVTRMELGPQLTAGPAISAGASTFDNTGLAGVDEWMAEHQARGDEFLAWYENMVAQTDALNMMLEDSIVSAMHNGLQALADMMMGLEDADMKNVLAAFIAPLGDTMKQMGAMIMAEGLAMEAFKKSFKNPYAAIAAGAALMAIGSVVSAGLQRLTANPMGGGSGASYGGAGSYGSSELANYENTLTIEVTGKISGSDIVISGNKTNNKWNR
jgi:hypothetical protein